MRPCGTYVTPSDGTTCAGRLVVTSVELDAAPLHFHQADDGLDDRGFARTVGSDNRHNLARVHFQIHAKQNLHRPVGNFQAMDAQQGLCHAAPCFRDLPK